MRVVAFSCVHLATDDTQMELQDRLLDYRPAQELMRLLLANPPDLVVNLGDFTEPVYDGEGVDLVVERLLPGYLALEQVTKVVRVNGNHDEARERPFKYEADGIVYEHGYRFIGKRPDTREDYMIRLRKATAGMKIVHGHTHFPAGPWPLDVGSVTFSKTYGEIVDGEGGIHHLGEAL